MNLALSALIIILFLLPAFSFRIGISIPIQRKNEQTQTTHDIISRNVSKALSKLNFTETVFLFSIIPILLHLVSLCLVHLAGVHISYHLLLNIFAGKENVLANSSDDLFHRAFLWFLLYTLIETGIACLLGWLLIKWCGGKSWLLRILMGNNVWFKLFSGAVLNTDQRRQLTHVMIEALIETKENSVIYSGVLKSYEIVDNSNDLAYITLTGAFRRDLRKAQLVTKELEVTAVTTSSKYDIAYGDIIPIPGHTFTLPGKEIINMNVTYMKQVIDPVTNNNSFVRIAFNELF
jgi:hypothetical protein